jgi:hypothetical protein
MVLLEALVARPRSGEYATRLVGFPQPHLTLPAGMSVRPLFTGVATERSGDRLRRIVRWGLRVGAQVLATAAPLGAGPSLPLSSHALQVQGCSPVVGFCSHSSVGNGPAASVGDDVTQQGEPLARFSRFDHVNVCTKP